MKLLILNTELSCDVNFNTAGVGQRVHVGKVNMDYESTAITTHQSVEETRKSVAIELCTVMIYDYFVT